MVLEAVFDGVPDTVDVIVLEGVCEGVPVPV